MLQLCLWPFFGCTFFFEGFLALGIHSSNRLSRSLRGVLVLQALARPLCSGHDNITKTIKQTLNNDCTHLSFVFTVGGLARPLRRGELTFFCRGLLHLTWGCGSSNSAMAGRSVDRRLWNDNVHWEVVFVC